MDAKDRISKYIDFKGISVYKLEVDAGFPMGIGERQEAFLLTLLRIS